ncbi:hypothetical protein GO308_09820 [Sphingomonas sp. SFZ2018-12]|uniref:hypothetical protein n=1 Tax=Sphingomonas sp. SFZ2018-12 TaxID=2683197 RepID=UPI001F100392|nr:hypothetical protein [Sphingomonas sp. SFZ2018-12]MCH4893406.1 hypothetical protein [Sphingomonas sp. SFZ2018-12]
MIRLDRNDAGEAIIRLHLPNGWTASILPIGRYGIASLIAWPAHTEAPCDGALVGAQEAYGDDVVEFLAQIAAMPDAPHLLPDMPEPQP